MLAVLGMTEKEGQENNAVDAVRVPANLYVTKLERSCNAATHNGSTYSAGLTERQGRVRLTFARVCIPMRKINFPNWSNRENRHA